MVTFKRRVDRGEAVVVITLVDDVDGTMAQTEIGQDALFKALEAGGVMALVSEAEFVQPHIDARTGRRMVVN